MGHITGYLQLSVAGSAVPITAPGQATTADVIAEGAIRYRSDGTAPTATVGMPLVANQPVTFAGDQVNQVQFISQSGTVKVNIELGYGG